MVRIKHRYILFTILYPSTPPPTSTSTSTQSTAAAAAAAIGDSSTQPPTPTYILFQRPSPPHLTNAHLTAAIRSSIQSLFGDHGLSVTQPSLRLVYFSPRTSTGILRVPRAQFRLVWAALTFLVRLPSPSAAGNAYGTGYGRGRGGGGARGGGAVRGGGGGSVNTSASAEESLACVVRVVRVSGTIRKSEEEVLRRARMEIVRAKRDGRSIDDDGEGEGGLAELDDVAAERVFGGQSKSIGKGRGNGNGRQMLGNTTTAAGRTLTTGLAGGSGDDGNDIFDDDDDDDNDDYDDDMDDIQD